MSDTKFITWFTKAILGSFGIFENPLHCVIYPIIFISCCLICISGSVIGFLNATGVANKLEAFTFITAQVNPLLMFVEVNICKRKLLHLFDKLQGKQDKIDDIIDQTNTFVKKKLFWYFVAFYVQSLGTVLPSIISAFTEDQVREKRSLFLPFWFTCENHNFTEIRSLMKYFCWDIETKQQVFIKNISQLVLLCPEIVVYFTSFALYGIAVAELTMHMENIKTRTRRLIGIAIQVDRMLKSKKSNQKLESLLVFYEEHLHGQFLDIVKYQQFLHSCVVQTVDMWKRYVTFYYFTYLVDLTMYLFVIFMELADEKLLAIKFILLSEMRLFMAFVIAQYAQTVSHLNEDFLYEIAQIPWYDRSMKFRKMYLKVWIIFQKSKLVKIAGIVELNLNTYAQMLKRIYSIFNALILRYRK